MGKKWGNQITHVLTIILILSLTITNSIKFVEGQTDESIEDEQVLVISTTGFLNVSMTPFTSGGWDQYFLIVNPVGASLYQKYAPLSNGEHDYVPQLAAELPTISADGTTYTVKLRSDLKFSNGNRLTAEDVVFSYNLYQTPSIHTIESNIISMGYNEVSNLLPKNSSITKIDPRTIQFQFSYSSVLNFEILTQKPIIERSDANLAKLNSCIVGNQGECDWTNNNDPFMVGAGPYMIESQNTENHEIQLVKNPYYHSKEVWADRLIMQGGLEDNASLGVIKGEADVVAMGTNSVIFESLGDTQYNLFLFPHARVETIDLNMQHPVFGTGEKIPDGDNALSSNDLIQARLVRTALSHAMDRNYLGLEIWGGSGTPATAPISPLSLGFNSSISPHEFSLDTAKQYLEQAGFDFNDINDSNGDGDYADENDTRFFDFTVMSSTWIDRVEFLNHTKEQLSKIGIGLNLRVSSYDIIFQRTLFWANNTQVPIYDEGGVDAAVWQWSFTQPFSAEGFYNSRGLCTLLDRPCFNYGNYINPEYERLVEEYDREGSDWVHRQELMAQMHQILFEDLPSIPISYPSSPAPIKKGVIMPDGKYGDSNIMLWEYARKEDWDPVEIEDEDNGLDLANPSVGIVVGIVLVAAVSGELLRRKRSR